MRSLFKFLYTALLFVALPGVQPAGGQVTSIFLSYRGSPVPTLTEDARQVVFDVLAPYHSEVLTLEYRVVGGTALPEQDFVAASGVLTFQPGQQFRTLAIQLLDDREFEGSEQFVIELFNPVPATPISTPHTTITIQDDEFGYAPEFFASAAEDAGFIDIPIYRRGDIDFASSVEAYLEGITAQAGTDFAAETFVVQFAPNETVQRIRVRLFNNAIEDGRRTFRVRLRDPTGGVPIGLAESGEMTIEDNELGYALRVPFGATHPIVYEGGPAQLILERRGDYLVHTVAVVKAIPITTQDPNWWETPPAEPGADFIGSEFQVEFAPGQASAIVPLTIVNDSIAESLEWLRLEHTISISDPAFARTRLLIRDNEFNPLPVATMCLGVDIAPFGLTPLRDGGFLAVTGDENSDGYNYRILRFSPDGQLDPNFTPMIADGRPTKIVEGPGGNFTVRLWRDIEEGLRRFEADGRPDAGFRPFNDRYVWDFDVAPDGKIYVTGPLRRLNTDGTLDTSFAASEINGDDLLLDSRGRIYAKHSFGWVRLDESGTIDPSFAPPGNFFGLLREMDGALYGDEWGVFSRFTDTGEIDPAFAPISGAFVEPAGNGQFYAFRSAGSETMVERYNSDGAIDPTYMRGTLDTALDLIWYGMENDHRAILVYDRLGVREINGATMHCASGSLVARIGLDVPVQRALVEPNTDTFLERATGDTKSLVFIRTGNNETAATIRYRVRPGSALPGEHYSIVAEGEARLESGESRSAIPIMIIDNAIPELDRHFFVDLLDENGTAVSTAQITIQNDDVGLQILSHNANAWRILPISGEFPNFLLMRSENLSTWEVFRLAPGGVPLDLEMSGNFRFLWGRSIEY